jgi:hypothetical protein
MVSRPGSIIHIEHPPLSPEEVHSIAMALLLHQRSQLIAERDLAPKSKQTGIQAFIDMKTTAIQKARHS